MLSQPDTERLGAHVFNDERISTRGKQLYGILLKYVDVNKMCVLTLEILREEMKGSTSIVARAAKSLEQAGALRRYRPNRNRSEIRYTLLR